MNDDDRYRRFNLRIPKEAFARLQEAADARSHSMNAEIVQRLEVSLRPYSPIEAVLVGGGEISTAERELIGWWRNMTRNERTALRVVAQRLAHRSDDDSSVD